MPFHNPYNFLPALPRRGGGGAELMPEPLRDGEPPGHHRWHAGRWSGEIAVTLRVVTPLLLMRERPGDGPDRHRHLEVATASDHDGTERVDLAPTQLKGMLRTAYEAVTNSRFGVFQHRDPVGYRMAADGQAQLRPAIITSGGRVVLPGKLNVVGGPTLQPVATVRTWVHDATRTWLHPGFAHGDEVDAVIEQITLMVGRNHDVPLQVWQAISLHHPGQVGAAPGRLVVRGRLHAPGPTIEPKHSERLFITEVVHGDGRLTPGDGTIVAGESGERLVTAFAKLVRHQRSIHRSARSNDFWDGKDPWSYVGHEPGQTAWSRHLYGLDDPERKDRQPPAWVGPDTRVPPRPGEVVTCWAESTAGNRLQPVMVSRLLYRTGPAALLHESLRPAESVAELSPADRLFGWTWQRPDESATRPDPPAHRGQLRIVRVTPPSTDAVEDLDALTIPSLSTPKPSQGRFYVGERQPNGSVGPLTSATGRDDFFNSATQGLRGRKVYPHHRGLEGLDTLALRSRFDYGRTKPIDRPMQDSQNTTLHQWVRPGAEFSFVIQVTDVHPMELGALLWLLDPTRCGDKRGPARHRLGMGKPLGFGSVELSVDAGKSHLYTGEQMFARLEALDSTVEAADWSGLAADFETAMAVAFRAVLAAARTAFVGFAGNVPVHYPRTAVRSPTYEWFKDNERPQGGKLPLPLLGGGTLPDFP